MGAAMTRDDPRTLETIADGLDRARMPFQAELLRLIAGRYRQMARTVEEIYRETLEETEMVEEAARARNEAIARGEATPLRRGAHAVVTSGLEPETVA
jgi:hypothetical protein